MEIFKLFTVAILLAVCFVIMFWSSPKKATQNRNSRDMDQKMKKVDENTKRRVLAMHAAGVPHDAIAQKIAYAAGGKAQASRLVQAIKSEADKKSRGR